MSISYEVLAPFRHILRQLYDIVRFNGFDLVFWWVDGFIAPLKESGRKLKPMKINVSNYFLAECIVRFILNIVLHPLFLMNRRYGIVGEIWLPAFFFG